MLRRLLAASLSSFACTGGEPAALAPEPAPEPALALNVGLAMIPAAVAGQPHEPALPGPRQVYFGSPDGNHIALTFDDGPSSPYTLRILRALKRHRARATFFVLGHRVERYPDLLGEIVAGGHELGNHGFSHRPLRALFPSQIRGEIERTEEAIAALVGERPRFFRPPFGRFAPSAEPIFAESDVDLILWSVDSADWERSAEAIVEGVLRDARPGAIVLLHEPEPTTVEALPAILEGLDARGLRPVTVSELIDAAAYR